jgi:RNA-directed DNA polymerase
METWSAHHLLQEARLQHDPETAYGLLKYAQRLIAKGLPVVFTLGHLAKITKVSRRMLRETVERKRESANYRMFAVKKRSGGRRHIHSVSNDLFAVQKFINQFILQRCKPHPSSFAFHSSGGIRDCAAMHCGARWLFQYDLRDFFYTVTEMDVYQVFKELGYRQLLAFEMARLTTTSRLPKAVKTSLLKQISRVYYSSSASSNPLEYLLPYSWQSRMIGVLPQGAPSSPMLSNLVARRLDEPLQHYASTHGFVYTRYADDLTISATTLPDNQSIGSIHRAINCIIRKARFCANKEKTRIAGPGSKKLVLGLLVDGKAPRLSRETYHRIDRHLHAANKYGLEATASHEKFDSAWGFYNHLSGLVAFVKDVDKPRWEQFKKRFDRINPPWNEAE